jgi:cation transport ATPase
VLCCHAPGVSTLHHHFRSLTAMSPLQYQKQLRLHIACERMFMEGLDAATSEDSRTELAVMVSDILPGHPLQHLLLGPWLGWIEFALATPVIPWAGWPFFQRGWASVVHRSPNMFTLIASRLCLSI